ncbi:MAG TPA: hypothetical protein VHQ66_12080 [Myxococcota bacterium]|jgi:hypothetical protein|nr:hypothetical protein [Myxococcota bacterium]
MPRRALSLSTPALLAAALAAPVAADDAPAPVTPQSGLYEMSGETVDHATGVRRPIQGTIVVRVEGGRYTTHFEFSTLFPGTDATAARVTGTGEGRVEGARLVGEAHTQLTVAAAPGVDVGFAYVPRQVSPRIRSTSTATFLPDGSVRAEIENVAEEGTEYAPTKTTLKGTRRKEPPAKPSRAPQKPPTP